MEYSKGAERRDGTTEQEKAKCALVRDWQYKNFP